MAAPAPDYAAMSDAELAERAHARDHLAVRIITSRNNKRLFRAAWSVLRNRPDAEEAVQEAYLKAFTGRARFTGASSLSTWLTRVVINEALERRRAAQAMKRRFDISLIEEFRDRFAGRNDAQPEAAIARAEIAKLLEQAIARLPDEFRTVFVLRDVEDMSVEDTAQALGLAPATVKTRLFRARRRLRAELTPTLRNALHDTFHFAGEDCARLTARTLSALCIPEET